jgi:hypothetical protein
VEIDPNCRADGDFGNQKREPVNFSEATANFHFTRLHAHIVQEDGAFTVRVRMLNHLKEGERAWGEEIAATIDMASAMIGSLASQFSIPQQAISIKIVMLRYKDGTFH